MCPFPPSFPVPSSLLHSNWIPLKSAHKLQGHLVLALIKTNSRSNWDSSQRAQAGPWIQASHCLEPAQGFLPQISKMCLGRSNCCTKLWKCCVQSWHFGVRVVEKKSSQSLQNGRSSSSGELDEGVKGERQKVIKIIRIYPLWTRHDSGDSNVGVSVHH